MSDPRDILAKNMANNFTYHPPTRSHCTICEGLIESKKQQPIIDKFNGKASSASNFPIHNWYYFVLGYSPEFPLFILEREKMNYESFVVDPFMGTGTTLISCKTLRIPSGGIDANDYFIDVVKAKTNFSISTKKLEFYLKTIVDSAQKIFDSYSSDLINKSQFNIFQSACCQSWESYAEENRQKMMSSRYISDIPFSKLHILKSCIDKIVLDSDFKSLFDLAISSIIVPISNVKYGPGFGVSESKTDVDVLGFFIKKVNRMICDLNSLTPEIINTKTIIKHGDSRNISKYFEKNSVDLMITSPPYPGDHEYTKHTRLELIFMGYADTQLGFREIKKRMIRGSTTNIYKEDNDIEHVKHFKSIQDVTKLIDERLKADNATSGFEKLYTRLVWEYFGGMYRMLTESKKLLKNGGKISLLVSDSHAFKMVHILTADILAEIGLDIGYQYAEIELWQDKVSTSHSYHLRENIITLTK